MAEALGDRQSAGTPWSILVVDDDPGVTQTFARILRLSGYGVLTAIDASAAFRQIETMHPDAILIGFRRPAIGGLTFLRALRAYSCARSTPVAVVTADYSLDDAVSRELRDLGASIYFKPLWFNDLLNIAAALVGKPR
jgi:DNA-binding response OmpR family regulator